MTNQPVWKCIAQLGDATPLDYGGYWIFVDTTGVYPPEAEYLIAGETASESSMSYRFSLDACTFYWGILSDNKYHPEMSAWFAKPEWERLNRPQDTTYLTDVCRSMDCELIELIGMFVSDNPIKRADAYRTIGDYHGWENFDSYPLTMTEDEKNSRYADPVYNVEEGTHNAVA